MPDIGRSPVLTLRSSRFLSGRSFRGRKGAGPLPQRLPQKRADFESIFERSWQIIACFPKKSSKHYSADCGALAPAYAPYSFPRSCRGMRRRRRGRAPSAALPVGRDAASISTPRRVSSTPSGRTRNGCGRTRDSRRRPRRSSCPCSRPAPLSIPRSPHRG